MRERNKYALEHEVSWLAELESILSLAEYIATGNSRIDRWADTYVVCLAAKLGSGNSFPSIGFGVLSKTGDARVGVSKDADCTRNP
jgi:hypothetical protein